MVHAMALEIGNTTNERGRQGMSFDGEFLLSPNGKEAISKSPWNAMLNSREIQIAKG